MRCNQINNPLPINVHELIRTLNLHILERNIAKSIDIIEQSPLLLNYILFKGMHYDKKNFKSQLNTLIEIVKQKPSILTCISLPVVSLIAKHADQQILYIMISSLGLNANLIAAVYRNRYGLEVLLEILHQSLDQRNFAVTLRILKYDKIILEILFARQILHTRSAYYVNCLAELIEQEPEVLFKIGNLAISNICEYSKKSIITRILSAINNKVFSKELLAKIANNYNIDEEILLQLISFNDIFKGNVNLIKLIAEHPNTTKKIMQKLLSLNYIDLDIDILKSIVFNSNSDKNILRLVLKKLKTAAEGNFYQIKDVLVGVAKNINATDGIFMQILSCNNYSDLEPRLFFEVARHKHVSAKVLRLMLSERYAQFISLDVLAAMVSNINANEEILSNALTVILHRRHVAHISFVDLSRIYTPSYLLSLISLNRNVTRSVLANILSPPYQEYIDPRVLAIIASNKNSDEEMLEHILSLHYKKHIDAFVLAAIAGNKNVTRVMLDKILSPANINFFFNSINLAEKIFMLSVYKVPAECIIKVLGEYPIEQLISSYKLPILVETDMLPSMISVNFQELIAPKLVNYIENNLLEHFKMLPTKILMIDLVAQLIISFIVTYDQYAIAQDLNPVRNLCKNHYNLISLRYLINKVVDNILVARKSRFFAKKNLLFSMQEQQARTNIIKQEKQALADLFEDIKDKNSISKNSNRRFEKPFVAVI